MSTDREARAIAALRAATRANGKNNLQEAKRHLDEAERDGILGTPQRKTFELAAAYVRNTRPQA